MRKSFMAIAALLVAALVTPVANAAKPFYDSKSWIVNVAGDVRPLYDLGLEPKVNHICISLPTEFDYGRNSPTSWETVEERLNDGNYGKAVINALTVNGTSERQLGDLALRNAQRADKEFGQETMRVGSGENLSHFLSEQGTPILTHNYIMITQNWEYEKKVKDRTEWIRASRHALFHVEIDNQEAQDIIACLGDPTRYARLQFKVKLVYDGDFIDLGKFSREVPDLAMRGVLLRRHPARISIGSTSGIKKGDLVTIYSQRQDKNGNNYSKRISRARVGKVYANEAQINFEANTAGNRKNGDVVVRTPDNHLRMSLMAMYSPHVWGGDLLFDVKSGFQRSGIIHHTLFSLGFNMTDKPGNKYTLVDNPDYGFKSPVFFNVGLGYGISKTFLGFMDFMLFAQAQYEACVMWNTKLFEDTSIDRPDAICGNTLRVPVGLRFSFNIGYPLRLAVEGGYAFRCGGGFDNRVVNQTMKYLDAKRDGLFLGLGLIF